MTRRLLMRRPRTTAERRAAERAAVVAWLHRQGGRSAWTLVQDIERGEHRR